MSETTAQPERTAVIMDDNEWAIVKAAAKKEFEAELGERPNRKSVEKTRHDKPFINMVMWFGIISLAILVIYTSYKNFFATLPFAAAFSNELLEGQVVDGWVVVGFQIVNVVMSIILASPSLIFFKLLSGEERIIKKIKETRRDGWFSAKWFDLNYITPRLPQFLTLMIMAWQGWVAAHSVHSLTDFFLLTIPVLAELTLAQLVGDIMQQNVRFYDIVTEVLKEKTDKWDAELAAYSNDTRYLEALYRHLRSGIFNIVREDERRRKVKPNAWMKQSTNPKIEDFIAAEYKRLTGGKSFSIMAQRLNSDRTAGQPDNVAVVSSVAPAQPATTHKEVVKRVPPNGDKVWTVKTMIRDFELQGLSKEGKHDRGWLDKHYQSGYGHRTAWADGAKDYFAS